MNRNSRDPRAPRPEQGATPGAQLQAARRRGQTVQTHQAVNTTESSLQWLAGASHRYAARPRHGGPAKEMRNAYEQYLYDKFGDGPNVSANFVNNDQLYDIFRTFKIPQSEWENQTKAYGDRANAAVDAQGKVINGWGIKPFNDDMTADVQVVRIPNTNNLAIRFFDGGLERDGAWVFDFYDIRDRRAVNSFEGWTVYISPTTPNTTSLIFGGEVKNWEVNNGIERDDIKPGEERFSVPEGVTCSLVRPGCQPFWFNAPRRAPDIPNVRIEEPISLHQAEYDPRHG